MTSWNGQAWSAPVTLDGANNLEAVGCAPTGSCAAVDAEGNAFAYSGGSWAGTSGDWGSVSAISCVSPSFCMSTSGGISQWNGDQWTQPNPYGDSSSFAGVSCPNATLLHRGRRIGWGPPVERPVVVGSDPHRTRTGVGRVGHHHRGHPDRRLLPLEPPTVRSPTTPEA